MTHYYLHHFRPRGRLGADAPRAPHAPPLPGRHARLRHQRAHTGTRSSAPRPRPSAPRIDRVFRAGGVRGPLAGGSRLRNDFHKRTERNERAVAATNINRVVLTGNLTADPELRSLPSGTSVCSLRVACNTRRKNASHRRMGGQAQLLQRHRLGSTGRERRPLPRPRAAPWRSTDAWSGASGRPRTAPSARRSISLPTRCSSWARARTPARGGGFAGQRRLRAARYPSRKGTSSPHRSPAGTGDDDIPF